jgi:asparagine N-glycosylation enzyme membrane subunit Stt3
LKIAGAEFRSPPSTLAIGFLIFLAALLARIANFQTAFVGGIPQLSPFDELYHAKRIAFSAAHPFRVLSFDPNRGPRGSFCPWPPLYDMSAGALARLLGGRTPAKAVALASWFPPIVSSLVAAFVAAWLARRFSAATGILAGLGIAFSTYFLDESHLAAIDHHFLEFPLVLGLMASVWVAKRATSPREALRDAGILALALTTGLLVQPALLFAAALAMVAILLLDSRRNFPRVAAACGFFLSAGMLFLYRQLQPPGYPDSQWYLGIPHATALAGAGAACLAQLWLLKRGLRLFPATLFALAVGGALAAGVPNAAAAVAEGSHFLGGDPWLKNIAEFRPLFSQPDSSWWVDLCLLGGGLFLTVPMAVTQRWRRGGRALLLLFTLAYSFASISSTRFLAVAAPLCAISGAVAVLDLRTRRARPFAVAAAVVLIAPSLLVSTARALHPAPTVTADKVPLLRAAEFLRRQTAPGRVLGPWSWGHLFNVVAGRGVLLDNFGTTSGRTDFENGAGIVFATRESEVADYCARYGVRFLVLQDPIPYFAGQAEMSGLPRSAYETRFASRSGLAVTPLMRATFWWRAYFEGGRERTGRGPAGAAFRHLRLARIETEASPSKIRSAVQIWEYEPATSSQ